MFRRSRQPRGQSFVEVLVALGIVSLALLSIAGLLGDAFRLSTRGSDQSQAASIASEGINATKSIAKRAWSELVAGTTGLTTGAGYYALSGTNNVIGSFTRQIILEDVNRDGSGNITLVGGSNDSQTKKVTSRVTWLLPNGATETLNFVTYLTQWFAGFSWIQTAYSDFLAGFRHGSVLTNATGGEVEMGNYGPYGTINLFKSANLPNNIDTKAIISDDRNNVFVAKLADGAGPEFIRYDVANMTAGVLTQLDTEEIGANVNALAVSGDYAYLGTSNTAAEVRVYKLSTSAMVNTWNLTGTAVTNSLAISGNVLYVGRATSGSADFTALNITNPEGALSVLGSTEIGGDVNGIAISGIYAFLATSVNANELRTVRTTDYTIVSNFNQAGNNDLFGISIRGTVAYVVGDRGAGEFEAINIATPTGPLTSAGFVNMAGVCRAVDAVANGTRAFVGCDDAFMYVLNTTSFTTEGSIDATDDIDGIQFADTFIYAATSANAAEVQVYTGNSTSGWANATQVGTTTFGVVPYDLDVVGNYAYAVTAANGAGPEFNVVNITIPASPSVVGTLEIGQAGWGIDVEGNYAYVTSPDTAGEFRIMNVTTPTAPTLSATLNLPGTGSAQEPDVVGNYAYIARSNAGSPSQEFTVVDVTNPASPTAIGGVDVTGDLNDVYVSGNYAYVVGSDDAGELRVINITTPATPTVAATLDLPGTQDTYAITGNGNYLYLGRDTDGGAQNEFVIVDVTTPTSPTVLNGYSVAELVRGISFSDDIVFMTTDPTLYIIDVTAPTSPLFAFTNALGGVGWETVGFTDYVYTIEDNAAQRFRVYQKGALAGARSPEAKFRSQIFDAASSVTWDKIRWTVTLPGGTAVNFQVRTSNTLGGIDTATFVGPDGTPATFYTTSDTTIVTHSGATGTRYVQWQVGMTTTGSSTPTLSDVTLTYF